MSSHGNWPLGENTEAFHRAPLATITDEAPYKKKGEKNHFRFIISHTRVNLLNEKSPFLFVFILLFFKKNYFLTFREEVSFRESPPFFSCF